VIELHHISKRFGPLVALEDVSLSISPGKILGLLGENGAGKSTLMNILFGLLRPDSGTIRAAGRDVRISSPRVAQALGIGMVHQHFKLVPSLTALENFALFLAVPRGILHDKAAGWLEKLHWSIPLETRIDELAVGQQQRVEIVKALLTLEQTRQTSAPGSVGGSNARNVSIPDQTPGKVDACAPEPRAEPGADLLILDEPTAVLTPQETAELFTAMRTLREAPTAGRRTAIVFISHKLAEVRQICDDIAILRRGRLVHTGPAADLPPDAIAEKMVGTRIEMPHLARHAPSPPSAKARGQNSATTHGAPVPPLLTLKNLSTPLLKNVSLDIAPGEILGIAGVDGNGQSHLVQTILGILRPTSGEIAIAQKPANALPTRERLNAIAFIAEDRQKEALVLPLSIRDNLLLKDYRSRRFNTLGWLHYSRWNAHAIELMEQFDIRAASPADAAGQLSGGNQQKVVLARELYSTDKPIILAVNPTRGLDVGASAFVLQKLLDARRRGAAILLIHSDLDELLAISDRVAVIYNGTLSPTAWPVSSKEQIGRRMLGLKNDV